MSPWIKFVEDAADDAVDAEADEVGHEVGQDVVTHLERENQGKFEEIYDIKLFFFFFFYLTLRRDIQQ
jgi:hypothetical protein